MILSKEDGEYAEIRENGNLYIYEGYLASVLLTKDEVIKLFEWLKEIGYLEKQGGRDE